MASYNLVGDIGGIYILVIKKLVLLFHNTCSAKY